MGSFIVFWTTLSFLLAHPPYHFDSKAAGLFGLVGVVGTSIAPVVGRLSDRLRKNFLIGISLGITLFAFIVFWMFGLHLWGLIAGVIVLDLGVQSAIFLIYRAFTALSLKLEAG